MTQLKTARACTNDAGNRGGPARVPRQPNRTRITPQQDTEAHTARAHGAMRERKGALCTGRNGTRHAMSLDFVPEPSRVPTEHILQICIYGHAFRAQRPYTVHPDVAGHIHIEGLRPGACTRWSPTENQRTFPRSRKTTAVRMARVILVAKRPALLVHEGCNNDAIVWLSRDTQRAEMRRLSWRVLHEMLKSYLEDKQFWMEIQCTVVTIARDTRKHVSLGGVTPFGTGSKVTFCARSSAKQSAREKTGMPTPVTITGASRAGCEKCVWVVGLWTTSKLHTECAATVHCETLVRGQLYASECTTVKTVRNEEVEGRWEKSPRVTWRLNFVRNSFVALTGWSSNRVAPSVRHMSDTHIFHCYHHRHQCSRRSQSWSTAVAVRLGHHRAELDVLGFDLGDVSADNLRRTGT